MEGADSAVGKEQKKKRGVVRRGTHVTPFHATNLRHRRTQKREARTQPAQLRAYLRSGTSLQQETANTEALQASNSRGGVEVGKRRRHVLPTDAVEDYISARVVWNKGAHVQHIAVHDNPQVILRLVLRHLLLRVALRLRTPQVTGHLVELLHVLVGLTRRCTFRIIGKLHHRGFGGCGWRRSFHSALHRIRVRWAARYNQPLHNRKMTDVTA
ncbi:cytochrome b5-like heme/steroid binding domain containing protein, putative [Leishmania tarentolae]|uniref:Cytochrome b5-like heme/steroid binding domain containing protein, putative n=1 Tax=Leishmania tarentolae TaxID=5689 RepID=A0A640KE25_LEITA|nr:cytochrome b5-like heme/steroid binding domain containing protein, putative [Leishmania tarentolae]